MALDVQSFLKENELGKLGKVYKVYSGDLLFEEYKTYPKTQPGGGSLKLTYIYSGNVQVAQQAEIGTWTQTMQDTVDAGNGTGPTGILLSNTDVDESASIGTFIGNLTAQNGVGPFTWTITNDPDNKFQIDGNDLEVGAALDYDTAQTHNVTIQVEDANNDTFEKTFLITVNEVAVGAGDKEVSFNGIDEACSNGNISEIDQGNVAFSIAMEITRSRQDVEETVFSQQIANTTLQGQELYFDSSNRLAFRLVSDASASSSLTLRLGAGAQHALNEKIFYVVTYDGSKTRDGLKFYKNAVLTGTTAPETTLSAGSDVTAGTGTLYGLRADGANYFQGKLDNIMVFNKVLSAAEITTLYNSGDPLEELTGALLAANVQHVPITSSDSYPTLSDERGNYDITMNANMSAGNIIDAGEIS